MKNLVPIFEPVAKKKGGGGSFELGEIATPGVSILWSWGLFVVQQRVVKFTVFFLLSRDFLKLQNMHATKMVTTFVHPNE